MRKYTQKITSAGTSISTVSKIFTQYNYVDGSIILDYGGGKYDKNIDYMRGKNCKVVVFDPFNRPQEYNYNTLNFIDNNGVDYITCSNVLNVIDNITALEDTLKQIALLTNNIRKQHKKQIIVLFTVYEKNKTGVAEITKKGFQRNAPLEWYLPYISEYFAIENITKGIIKCTAKYI